MSDPARDEWTDTAKEDWWGYGHNEHPRPDTNAEVWLVVRLEVTGTVPPWSDLAAVEGRAPGEWAAHIARLLNETSGLHLDGDDTHTIFAMDRATVEPLQVSSRTFAPSVGEERESQ